MGIDVNRLRIVMLIAASLLTTIAVAFASIIGFIELVNPHTAHMLVGEKQCFFIPASMTADAALLATAHVVSITVVPGMAVPISIITAVIGVPFFIDSIFLRRGIAWS